MMGKKGEDYKWEIIAAIIAILFVLSVILLNTKARDMIASILSSSFV